MKKIKKKRSEIINMITITDDYNPVGTTRKNLKKSENTNTHFFIILVITF